jgi:monothiol glutaredoxin
MRRVSYALSTTAVWAAASSLCASCRFETTSSPPPDKISEELANAIDVIIKKDRMVVFLTGTPQRPRCRFTAATVDILKQLGVKYSFFDILDDDEICEGLKVHSGWPTYPQIYVDGELVGGYDVCKSMLLSGELTKLLKEKDLL